MDCKIANQMIHPFINDSLSLDEMDDFMKHIEQCPNCREELEIYYTVQIGIHILDNDKAKTYDLKGLFEDEIEDTLRYLRWQYMLRSVKEFSLILGAICVLVTVILQMKIWF